MNIVIGPCRDSGERRNPKGGVVVMATNCARKRQVGSPGAGMQLFVPVPNFCNCSTVIFRIWITGNGKEMDDPWRSWIR